MALFHVQNVNAYHSPIKTVAGAIHGVALNTYLITWAGDELLNNMANYSGKLLNAALGNFQYSCQPIFMIKCELK